MGITIVGLGPGDPALLTRQAWEVLSRAGEVYLRTDRHPGVDGLPPGLSVHSFDWLYETAGDSDAVYAGIVAQVLTLGQRPQGVVYAVPGHPLVGEATVTALLEEAAAAGLAVQVVPGLSFIEPVLSALGVDGLNGLQVMDAVEVAGRLHPPLDPDVAALLGQLYSRELASDVKLTLMAQYPDEHPVHLIHSAGTREEQVESVPLHALDHSPNISHLTSLYVPPLPRTGGLAAFQETIARLRGPGGCPWDQQQTHQSLRTALVEETAELLDALDGDDMNSVCEELGDLLLLIVLHTRIATEDGDFTAADVIGGIEAKIRRRHPHVFGDVSVAGVDEVCANWEAIKRAEKGSEAPSPPLGRVPAALSALSLADEYARRAAEQGFDWPNVSAVVDQVREEISELLAADTPEDREAEMGDLLFALVNWARWLGVKPETALRMAVRRFRQRFQALESAVRAEGKSLAALEPEQMRAAWRDARLSAAD